MIKYRIRPGVWPSTDITPVEVDRESASQVWGSDGHHAKRSAYAEYHDTWAGARDSLLEHSVVTLGNARTTLARAQGLHGNIKGLKDPT